MLTIFTESDLLAGLDTLDREIEQSADLKPVAPLQLVVSGGFVTVRYLKNRTSTQGIDYFLHPSTPTPIKECLKAATDRVFQQLDYAPAWCNDNVTLFTGLLSHPQELFDQSIQQGVVLYSTRNLVVYAVLWIWSLVRKMKRLQGETLPPRIEDLMDCVALTKVVYHESGLIGKNLLQQFDHTQREPPIFRGTAEIVGNTAAEKWGVFPFNLDGLPEQ